ncbi:MAG: chaperonin GroEL [Rhodoferax sp.]|nr:chaperonin GroEL [Rhodoferax sp.]
MTPAASYAVTHGPVPLLLGDPAHARMHRGMTALAEAVRLTLGPRGRTVIIERPGAAPQIVNSGVVVARSIALADPFENMGAQLLREVAARTSEMAGDGTTTATVLAHRMVEEGLGYLATGMNPMALRQGIEQAVERVVQELRQIAQTCATPREIAHVASLSANNDTAIGELIARAMERVGREGAITIEDGSGRDSELEVVEGLRFDCGYLSPYFVNQSERAAAVLDQALVLLCAGRLSSVQELVPLLETVTPTGRPLLVIAEAVEGDALATLVVNSLRGVVKACAVRAPGFGAQRQARLQDLAVLTGAQVVGAEQGRTLATLRLADLGQARRVDVDGDHTTLLGGAGDTAAIAARVRLIRQERDQSSQEAIRQDLDARLAQLSGGVGVIRVGAATEIELKERRLRVDDALHATRAAVEEGIVPGGGVALLRARRALDTLPGGDLETDAGVRTVARALEEPLRRILLNAAVEPDEVLHQVLQADDPRYGYNAATRRYGDLLAMGVIDPVKVTRLALQNAGSIASLVLGTDCLVARPRGRYAAAT